MSPYDHVFQVTAWKDGPYWVLEIEAPKSMLRGKDPGYWATQTPWLWLAEYMVKDYLHGMLDLDDEHDLRVNVTKGIGPKQHWEPWSLRSWCWAQYAGVRDAWHKWRWERQLSSARR